MALSDAELVARAASGDDSAFDELVSRYRGRVYYLALSKVRAREIALDVAQDAFVQAYISLGKLREPEKFASWLMSITSNLCRMHFRRAREIAMPDEAIDALNSHRDAPESDMDATVAVEALDKLPEGTRSAALLFFVEEMKQAEIAEFLGISLSAVKSRIREARARLQKEMIEMVRHAARKEQPGDEFNKRLQHKIELARWYREFADLITNGVPLLQTLDMLAQQAFSEPVKAATGKLRDAVSSGSMLSEAMKELPALTTPQAVGMVRAGEIGGILDWTAQFLADWIEIENGQRELELAFWCRTFGSVLAAGAPAKLALECSFDIVRDPGLKKAARDLADALEAGKPLEGMLDRHKDALLPIVRVSILAGEKEAVLGYALQWAANAVHSRMAERLLGAEFQPPTAKAPWMKESVEGFARGAAAYLEAESPAMRASAVTIIGRQGVLEYVRLLPKVLSDNDSGVRKAAIHALADAEFTEASDALVRSLEDPDPSVRRASLDAISALRLHDRAKHVAQLVADVDQRVAHTAVKTLEAMGEIEVLTRRAIELLSSKESRDRVRAVYVLLWHPTEEAADALIRVLDDECGNVRHTSARALARLGRNQAIPGLIRALEYPHPHYTQRLAAEALAELGDPSAAPHIRKAIEQGRLDASYAWTAERLEGRTSP